MAELQDEFDAWRACDVTIVIVGHYQYQPSEKALGKQPAVEKRPPGRPKGSKDKVPRKPRVQLQINWEYGGKKGAAGTPVVHNSQL